MLVYLSITNSCHAKLVLHSRNVYLSEKTATFDAGYLTPMRGNASSSSSSHCGTSTDSSDGNPPRIRLSLSLPPCNSLSLWVSGFDTFYIYSTYSEGLSCNINMAENSSYFAEVTHFAKIKKSCFLRTRFGFNKTCGMADMRECCKNC